jgi:hypothetical protein
MRVVIAPLRKLLVISDGLPDRFRGLLVAGLARDGVLPRHEGADQRGREDDGKDDRNRNDEPLHHASVKIPPRALRRAQLPQIV